MILEPIDDGNSDFAKVELVVSSNDKLYPSCQQHGAMNKVSVYTKDDQEQGYWRCLQGLCRAGANEVRL